MGSKWPPVVSGAFVEALRDQPEHPRQVAQPDRHEHRHHHALANSGISAPTIISADVAKPNADSARGGRKEGAGDVSSASSLVSSAPIA
jgi:hypothetical protein